MPHGAGLLTLVALTLVASCSSAPKPSMKEVGRAWDETLQEWQAFHRQKLDTLDSNERDDYLDRHSQVMDGLHALSLATVMRAAAPDDTWHGEVRIEGESRRGAPLTIRLASCPPGRKFVLYSSADLALPMPLNDEKGDFWVLDRGRQVVEAEGTVDSRGEARVTLALSEDPALAGAFRAYQARILNDPGAPSGPTLGFTTAHGRRLK